jgi:DNA mismatch endonuclease, patch repair protein
MDVLTREQRSLCMSRIRGKNTRPEMRLRLALWAVGLRYRIHARLPGRPDVVFPSARVAVFVDGCFWHGCPDHGVKPKTNAQFWEEKIASNAARDRRNNAALQEAGWSIVRIWEHELRGDLTGVVRRIRKLVVSRRSRSAVKKPSKT